VILLSCNLNNSPKEICTYKLNSYITNFDTSRFTKTEYDSPKITEIMDKPDIVKERGFYKFDQNNTLRFYAFLLNNKNEYNFSIEYDSLGNEINKSGTEVVHWYFRRLTNDNLRITFLLYSIHHIYKNVLIKYGTNHFNNIELQKSEAFSNIIGNTLELKISKANKSDTIYILGEKEYSCSHKIHIFTDFVLIPKEIL